MIARRRAVQLKNFADREIQHRPFAAGLRKLQLMPASRRRPDRPSDRQTGLRSY